MADVRLVEKMRDAIARGVTAMDGCIDRIQQDLAGEYNPRLASHLAFMLEKSAKVLGELRQLERHERNTVEAMTPAEKDALVREYISAMPPARLAEFKRWMQEET